MLEAWRQDAIHGYVAICCWVADRIDWRTAGARGRRVDGVSPADAGQPAFGITVGPDGALWFTEENGDKIGRITTAGDITEYPIPTVPAAPSEITTGPDGALWFTESGANRDRPYHDRRRLLHRVSPSRRARPRRDHGRARRGALVHRERRQQDRPDHGRRRHHRPYDLHRGRKPGDITTGPDGALWFTESEAQHDGRDHATGPQHHASSSSRRDRALGIVTPADGALWFTEAAGTRSDGSPTAGAADRRVRARPASSRRDHRGARRGALVHRDRRAQDRPHHDERGDHRVPDSHPVRPAGLDRRGPDGALWFTEFFGNKIGRIEPPPPPDPVDPPPPAAPAAGARVGNPSRSLSSRRPRRSKPAASQAPRPERAASAEEATPRRVPVPDSRKGQSRLQRPRSGKRTAGTVQVKARR